MKAETPGEKIGYVFRENFTDEVPGIITVESIDHTPVWYLESGPMADLIREFKKHPKDNRYTGEDEANRYWVTNPESPDSDNDTLNDGVESGITRDETVDNRMKQATLLGRSPTVAAVPDLRILPNSVVVTPKKTTTIEEGQTIAVTNSYSNTETNSFVYGKSNNVTVSTVHSAMGVLVDESESWSESNETSREESNSLLTQQEREESTTTDSAQFANVKFGGYFINIGTANLFKASLSIPVSIKGKDHQGEAAINIDFGRDDQDSERSYRVNFPSPFATTDHDEYYLTREQFRQHAVEGMPLAYNLTVTQGEFLSRQYDPIKGAVEEQTAEFIIEKNVDINGESVVLSHSYRVYAGGISENTLEDTGYRLPINPVTVREAFVAAFGFYQDDSGNWVFKKDEDETIATYRPSQVELIRDSVGKRQRRWYLASEGNTIPEDLAPKTKMLTEVIRPGDRFYLKLNDGEEILPDSIEHAVVRMGDNNKPIVEVVTKGLNIQEVTIKKAGEDSPLAVLTPSTDSEAEAFQVLSQELPEDNEISVNDAVVAILKTALRTNPAVKVLIQPDMFSGTVAPDEVRESTLIDGNISGTSQCHTTHQENCWNFYGDSDSENIFLRAKGASHEARTDLNANSIPLMQGFSLGFNNYTTVKTLGIWPEENSQGLADGSLYVSFSDNADPIRSNNQGISYRYKYAAVGTGLKIKTYEEYRRYKGQNPDCDKAALGGVCTIEIAPNLIQEGDEIALMGFRVTTIADENGNYEKDGSKLAEFSIQPNPNPTDPNTKPHIRVKFNTSHHDAKPYDIAIRFAVIPAELLVNNYERIFLETGTTESLSSETPQEDTTSGTLALKGFTLKAHDNNTRKLKGLGAWYDGRSINTLWDSEASDIQRDTSVEFIQLRRDL